MGNKRLDNGEKILLLGIFHCAAATFLMMVKFAPFHIKLHDIYLAEYTSNILLADMLIMSTILNALSLPLFKNTKPIKLNNLLK